MHIRKYSWYWQIRISRIINWITAVIRIFLRFYRIFVRGFSPVFRGNSSLYYYGYVRRGQRGWLHWKWLGLRRWPARQSPAGEQRPDTGRSTATSTTHGLRLAPAVQTSWNIIFCKWQIRLDLYVSRRTRTSRSFKVSNWYILEFRSQVSELLCFLILWIIDIDKQRNRVHIIQFWHSFWNSSRCCPPSSPDGWIRFLFYKTCRKISQEDSVKKLEWLIYKRRRYLTFQQFKKKNEF